jgi:hypothetical protein
MSFRIGQQVICIDDASCGKYIPNGFLLSVSSNMHGLKRGRVYTIRDLNVLFGVRLCRLIEIVRDFDPCYGEESYFAEARFRSLKETKTDVSVFTAMLMPDRESIDA